MDNVNIITAKEAFKISATKANEFKNIEEMMDISYKELSCQIFDQIEESANKCLTWTVFRSDFLGHEAVYNKIIKELHALGYETSANEYALLISWFQE